MLILPSDRAAFSTQVLYCAQNLIAKWGDVDPLKECKALEVCGSRGPPGLQARAGPPAHRQRLSRASVGPPPEPGGGRIVVIRVFLFPGNSDSNLGKPSEAPP